MLQYGMRGAVLWRCVCPAQWGGQAYSVQDTVCSSPAPRPRLLLAVTTGGKPS